MNSSDYDVLDKSGLVLVRAEFQAVRLSDEHLAIIARLIESQDDSGPRRVRGGRSAAIRQAIAEYCRELTQGRRYQSFSELVWDALAYANGSLNHNYVKQEETEVIYPLK